LVAAHAWVPEGMKLTPYGLRPASCVLELPAGASFEEVAGGVKIVTEIDGVRTEKIFTAPPECHQDHIVERYNEMQHGKGKGKGHAEAFPINGWLDNAGWYPPSCENQLDSFVSTYTIPGNPTTVTNQVLFYFIGMQDNNNPAALNIIQPVLTWGNGLNGWNAASWCCCPSNITVQSKSIPNLQAGWQLVGTIKRQDADTWMIDTKVVNNGQNTTLYAQVGGYNYNWADVTLEVYNVVNCNQFAVGPMTFSGLTLKDQQQQTLTPSWTITGTTDCNGKEVQVNATAITITHN
jgi:hypothetical protein